MQKLREGFHSPGEHTALAGYLPGLPGKAPADGDGHKKVPRLRRELYLPVGPQTLAEGLPVMPGKALRRGVKATPHNPPSASPGKFVL